jgi:hypothetical protein
LPDFSNTLFVVRLARLFRAAGVGIRTHPARGGSDAAGYPNFVRDDVLGFAAKTNGK